MYRCQLNLAMFCTTSALGVSWKHLNHPKSLVRALYRFHVFFHLQLILHHLGISLPHEDGFSKSKNSYIKVRIAVFVMTMALIEMKHGCRGTGFIRRVMVFLVMK